jgi:hypothetical protein
VRGAARALIDVVAERNGNWVEFDEAVSRAGVSLPQGRADMRGLARANKLLGSKFWNWPLQSRIIKSGKRQYRLASDLAREWTRLRTSQDEGGTHGDE